MRRSSRISYVAFLLFAALACTWLFRTMNAGNAGLALLGTPFPSPTLPPTSPPPAQSAGMFLNGISIAQVVYISPEAQRNAHEIFLLGAASGRNPHSFSKIGDSSSESPYFLGHFDGQGPYNLGDYDYLQPVIDQFAGSFAHQGPSVQLGMHTWSAMDPMWADETVCQPGENPLACEFRLHNPSVAFIRLGSNDSGTPEAFEKNLTEIISFCLEARVVPILVTYPDRISGTGGANNDAIRRLAGQFQLPLWDLDLIAETLPDNGLREDGVHMSFYYSHDYTKPEALQSGQAVQNLTALMALERVWREIMAP